MYNPHPRIERIELFDGHAVHVVDDALREPRRVVELAAAHRDGFAVLGHNAYPGPELRLPDAVSAELDGFFTAHLRAAFDVRRTERMYSRLAMVTFAPQQLAPTQWICHRDRFDVPPAQRALASVLYLFDDLALGGTAFFRPRRPLVEIERLIDDSARLSPAAFEARHGIAPGYPSANDWFEQVLCVPPRFNRMIFYDGSLFHAGHIPEPSRLSDDPRRGRLTLNGFFTCRRRAA